MVKHKIFYWIIFQSSWFIGSFTSHPHKQLNMHNFSDAMRVIKPSESLWVGETISVHRIFFETNYISRINAHIFEHCLLLLSSAQEWEWHCTDRMACCQPQRSHSPPTPAPGDAPPLLSVALRWFSWLTWQKTKKQEEWQICARSGQLSCKISPWMSISELAKNLLISSCIIQKCKGEADSPPWHSSFYIDSNVELQVSHLTLSSLMIAF